jgi:hypothetical protein
VEQQWGSVWFYIGSWSWASLLCERSAATGNLVERFFNQLKHFRAIATPYDKLARNFLAGVQLAAAMILLN